VCELLPLRSGTDINCWCVAADLALGTETELISATLPDDSIPTLYYMRDVGIISQLKITSALLQVKV